MAATKTVSQLPDFRKSTTNPELLSPRRGVVTLFGYGIQVRVNRGHLILDDGIGADRRHARFPRVGHRLERLVVIGADGMVSLSALRWLADQDAAFVMLDRDGTVLTTTGPVRSSDARLRRAQALAFHSGAALRITRELIGQKLAGQEKIARDKLLNSGVADMIGEFCTAIASAQTMQAIRVLESRAAAAYWSAWRTLPITFPKNDLRRVPDHWRTFGARISPISGSPRVAVNPVNAILNYTYALLESEARLAAAALGLDPGLGVLHVDTPARDSLACDLMEPVRPQQVDAFVLDWITRSPLKREWFFEQRNGNCRLMGEFAATLAETAPMWRHAVAPIAEWVARELWSTISKPKREQAPPTRLTQRRKREVKGAPSLPPPGQPPRRENVCRTCGTPIAAGSTNCVACAVPTATEHLVSAARSGRVTSKSAKARARLADTQRRHHAARRDWMPSDQPAWLDQETYDRKIQPLLGDYSSSAVASALGVSIAYAADVRAGRRRPHPRHWQALAQLVGLSTEK